MQDKQDTRTGEGIYETILRSNRTIIGIKTLRRMEKTIFCFKSFSPSERGLDILFLENISGEDLTQLCRFRLKWVLSSVLPAAESTLSQLESRLPGGFFSSTQTPSKD